MMRLRDLSLRYKIPLRVTVLVIGTAFAITASLVAREYDQLKRDLLRNAETMGWVLANTLVTPLVHDDVWRAYEVIASPAPGREPGDAPNGAEILMVLNAEQRVYVSSRPDRFPMFADPVSVEADYEQVQRVLRTLSRLDSVSIDAAESNRLYMIVPIASDGVLLGSLIMGYSKSVFVPRFYSLVWRAGLVTLAVLAVLLPVSWYSGHRTGVPLIQLADAMGRIGPRVPPELDFKPYDSRDEIGRLGAAFQRMVVELRAKQELEKEVILTERLTAIGRLSAGIAHEINNPLGGMLNAISTFKRHGSPEPALELLAQPGSEPCGQCDLPTRLALGGKTLSLLERGLTQIKHTVAALLVEARVESHPLSPQDIEDTRTLVLADANRKAARFVWQNDLREPLGVPSTLGRQVLINLLLNAIQAIEPGGQVFCRVYLHAGAFCILVKNDGAHIPPERMDVLFEPFASGREQGHGLGLWVTYQIVRQLAGEITVRSEPGETRFAIQIPLQTRAAA